jgi:phospholipid transport system substrate-binding protein
MGKFLQGKIFTVVLGATVLSLVAGVGSLPAAGGGPLEQLQQSMDQVLEILQDEELKSPERKEERRKRVILVVNEMFDFREMARSSLGQSWNSLSPAEQEKFVGLFTSLVEERYIGKIDSYTDQKVVFTKELVKGDRAMIYTSIVDKDLDIPIVYRLQKENDRWLAVDLKIENVSLVVNYRRDFDVIMRKEKFAGLVEKINSQLEKMQTSN